VEARQETWINDPFAETGRSSWKMLYRVGGLCALLAAVLEVAVIFLSIIFTRIVPSSPEGAIVQWFTLLHD